jgi:hypothetical protein
MSGIRRRGGSGVRDGFVAGGRDRREEGGLGQDATASASCQSVGGASMGVNVGGATVSVLGKHSCAISNEQVGGGEVAKVRLHRDERPDGRPGRIGNLSPRAKNSDMFQ